MMLKSEVISLLFLISAQNIIRNALGFSLNGDINHNPNNGASSSESTDKSTKQLSASQRERRDEEARRVARKNTATPGITSAIPGAKDFPLKPKKTEDELYDSSTPSENQIRIHTDRGMDALRMLKIEEAYEEFQKVYEMNPNTYCWQAGLVMFYLGMVHEGSECFVRNAKTWERRFGEPASEERIWRDACELKLRSMAGGFNGANAEDFSSSTQRFASQIEDQDLRETRKVLRITRQLFSATIKGDLLKVALARAKLRSLCSDVGKSNTSSIMYQADGNMWKLYSWFYLGLHYDVIGDKDRSKRCMKMALHQSGSFGNGKDVIQALPMLHMARRDWYDDDDFEEDDKIGDATWGQLDYFTGKEQEDGAKRMSSKEYLTESIEEGNNPDIVEIRSIMHSLDKMKLTQLRNCAGERGMKTTGSKSSLAGRLLTSLIREGF